MNVRAVKAPKSPTSFQSKKRLLLYIYKVSSSFHTQCIMFVIISTYGQLKYMSCFPKLSKATNLQGAG